VISPQRVQTIRSFFELRIQLQSFTESLRGPVFVACGL